MAQESQATLRRPTSTKKHPKFGDRIIALSVYESLHGGLKKLGKQWDWKVKQDEDIEEGDNPITREELGLGDVEIEKSDEEEYGEDTRSNAEIDATVTKSLLNL